MLVERIVPHGIRTPQNRLRRSVRTPALAKPAQRSLDSVNHLATSDSETFAQWLNRQRSAAEKRNKLYKIHQRLLDSLRYHALTDNMVAWNAAVEGAGSNETAWQEAKKARGGKGKWLAWKDFERVAACQTEWRGFRASCCDGRSVAVPIGCNHRLCPLCNAHRAEKYRSRVQQLFAKLANPQMLTLTVPNTATLTKESIRGLRAHLKAFLKANKALILGGVYSIEITFNRKERTWHPHIHCLVDIAGEPGKLPYWQFMERKWRLEFDWLLLTQERKAGSRVWLRSDFADWCAHLDPRRGGSSDSLRGHRRSVDLRVVSTDKKAAYEVMKYMTKVAYFVDDAKALGEFMRAVKGVRAIQTFGSCYGFSVEEQPVETTLVCECGANKWECIGILGLGMVQLSPEGKWYVRDDAPIHGKNERERRRWH